MFISLFNNEYYLIQLIFSENILTWGESEESVDSPSIATDLRRCDGVQITDGHVPIQQSTDLDIGL